VVVVVIVIVIGIDIDIVIGSGTGNWYLAMHCVLLLVLWLSEERQGVPCLCEIKMKHQVFLSMPARGMRTKTKKTCMASPTEVNARADT
jgi:hypothetical protein